MKKILFRLMCLVILLYATGVQSADIKIPNVDLSALANLPQVSLDNLKGLTSLPNVDMAVLGKAMQGLEKNPPQLAKFVDLSSGLGKLPKININQLSTSLPTLARLSNKLDLADLKPFFVPDKLSIGDINSLSSKGLSFDDFTNLMKGDATKIQQFGELLATIPEAQFTLLMNTLGTTATAAKKDLLAQTVGLRKQIQTLQEEIDSDNKKIKANQDKLDLAAKNTWNALGLQDEVDIEKLEAQLKVVQAQLETAQEAGKTLKITTDAAVQATSTGLKMFKDLTEKDFALTRVAITRSLAGYVEGQPVTVTIDYTWYGKDKQITLSNVIITDIAKTAQQLAQAIQSQAVSSKPSK